MNTTVDISSKEKSFKRSVIVATSISAFTFAFMTSAVNLAVPAIGREFNASAVELGWATSSYMLTSAAFMLIFGRLGDFIGRKKVFSIGLLLNTFLTIILVFSQNITMMIVLRALQGLTGAMVFGTNMAIVTAAFKPGERGKSMGINVTLTYLGLSLGPVIGGMLTQYFGWRSIFMFIVPFQIASLLLIRLKIKTEWIDTAGEKFDLKGAIAYGSALLAFMYGFSNLPAIKGWICLTVGILLGIVLVVIELKAANPIFEIRLFFTNRVFTFSSIAALINYLDTAAIGFFISLYLQYLKGFDARTAGMVMISQPAAMALMSSISGRLSDRFNPGIIASLGMGINFAGLVLLCFINENTHIAYIVPLLIMIGTGIGFFTPSNSNAIMSSVEKKYLGLASGFIGTVRCFGQMLSLGIAMILLSFYLGGVPITPSTYPSLIMVVRTGFFILAILSLCGIFASLVGTKRNN